MESNNELITRKFEDNYKLLFRIVYSIARNREDTLDILQETFLRAYLYYDPKISSEEILRWLIAISRNTAKTFIKQKKTFEPIENYVDRIVAIEYSFNNLILYDLKKSTALPEELFEPLMNHIIYGIPLLEICRKTDFSYERLRYWRKIFIKELALWVDREGENVKLD